MTETSAQLARDFILNLSPHLVADIGGIDSHKSYADAVHDIHVYDISTGHDITTHPLPRKYPCIICMDVFEHIYDPVAAALNIVSSLQHEGWLFLTTVFTWPIHRHPVDTYRYTEDSLTWLFRDLKIHRCWYTDDESGKRVSIICHKV